MRTSGEKTALLAGPIYTGQAWGGGAAGGRGGKGGKGGVGGWGRQGDIKRGAKASSLSLPHKGVPFSLCLWIDVPSHLEDGFSCYLLNKIKL